MHQSYRGWAPHHGNQVPVRQLDVNQLVLGEILGLQMEALDAYSFTDPIEEPHGHRTHNGPVARKCGNVVWDLESDKELGHDFAGGALGKGRSCTNVHPVWGMELQQLQDVDDCWYFPL